MVVVALSLCSAVQQMDRAACERQNGIPMRYLAGGRDYIGLRERKPDAVERARMNSPGSPVTAETHVLVKINFTQAGVAHFTTRSAGANHNYAPILFKKVYSDPTYDWKVWHFLEDLPLHLETSAGEPLVTSQWVDLD